MARGEQIFVVIVGPHQVSRGNEMEERYESATIMITVGLGERRMRWKPICRVKFMKGGREVIKDLKLDLDYGTSKQAERAGLVFSKKWVDAKL